MTIQYKSSSKWISYGLFVGFFVLAVILYRQMVTSGDRLGLLLIILPPALYFLMTLLVVNLQRIVLEKDHITIRGVFLTRKIRYVDIAYVASSDSSVMLYSRERKILALISDLPYIHQGEALRKALCNRFPHRQRKNIYLIYQYLPKFRIFMASLVFVGIGVYQHLYLSHIIGIVIGSVILMIEGKRPSWKMANWFLMAMGLVLGLDENNLLLHSVLYAYSYIGTVFCLVLVGRYLHISDSQDVPTPTYDA